MCYSLFSLSSNLQYNYLIFSSRRTISCQSLFRFIHHFWYSSTTISSTKRNKPFKEHVLEQMREHKQLLISPMILLILAMPRLIMSLVSGCVDPSNNRWLYLSAYFISFTPPMLVFAVFVLPSELYTKTFKESMTRCWRQIRQ